MDLVERLKTIAFVEKVDERELNLKNITSFLSENNPSFHYKIVLHYTRDGNLSQIRVESTEPINNEIPSFRIYQNPKIIS